MTYELFDGVRRARAADLRGYNTIQADLFDRSGGILLRTPAVALADLRSPRRTIARRTAVEDDRWPRVFLASRAKPFPFPPVTIREGTRGVRLRDITFEF